VANPFHNFFNQHLVVPDRSLLRDLQKNVRQMVLLVCLVAFSASAVAQDIANCRSPKGKAFYFNMGIVPKSKAGWDDDGITGGVFTLTRQGDDFDILYLDTTKKLVSSKSSGAVIQPLRIGENNFTLMVYYPNDTIEIYTFAKDLSGLNSLHLMQSKGGSALIHKSAILIAKCDYIRFNSLQ
jgi:hypothetical protein